MASLDEQPPAAEADEADEDPYQVYTLRRPHERASCVVAQLPKQPEMAETRLRYRRIPAAARSGSFGSLGNHFPARFHFPARRSLLESLTSDDESVSFAVSQKPRAKIVRKRRRRVRAATPRFPSPDAHAVLQDFAISDDDTDDDHHHHHAVFGHQHHAQHSQLRNGAARKHTHMSPKRTPPRIVYSKSGKPPILRRSSKKALSPPSKLHQSSAPRSPPASPPASPPPPPPAACASASRSAHEITLPSARTSGARDNTHVRACKSADSAHLSRQMAAMQPLHERPKHVVATVLDPARSSALPVTILPPQAMSEEQRQKFVLMAEEPVFVTRGARSDGAAKKKKQLRKKGDKGGAGRKAPRGSPTVAVEERSERDELGGLRDKELSVSFAQPRYTAEQAAAAKPLNAVQRLLHMLAFVRIGGARRWGHRR